MELPEVNTLQKAKIAKIKNDATIFNSVLMKCIEEITWVNKHTDKTFTVFKVPTFLLSYPEYSPHDCVLFLISKLTKKSYIANFIGPNYIHIDWGNKKKADNTSYIKRFMQLYPDAKIEFEEV